MKPSGLLSPPLSFLFIAAALGLAPMLGAQEHVHGGDAARLGRVVFPVSCARRRGRGSSTRWRCSTRSGGRRATAPSARSWRPTPPAPWRIGASRSTPGAIRSPAGRPAPRSPRAPRRRARASALPARTPRERGFVAAAAALYRDAESTPNAARLQAYADTMARLYRDFPKDVEVAIYYALASWRRPRDRHDLRPAAAGHRDPRSALRPVPQPSRSGPLRHPRDRQPATGAPGAERGAALRPDRAGGAARAAHAVAHLRAPGPVGRDHRVELEVVSGGRELRQGEGAAGGAPEELHALDYAVYAYLQRGPGLGGAGGGRGGGAR